MSDARIICSACGQDYIRPFRSRIDGRQFLLCPECDSVWLPGDDTSEWPPQRLDKLFEGVQFLPGEVAWHFIEPVEPDPE